MEIHLRIRMMEKAGWDWVVQYCPVVRMPYHGTVPYGLLWVVLHKPILIIQNMT